MTSPITTHVLDTARGAPAVGVAAVLEISTSSGWKHSGKGVTNSDGRIADLMPAGAKLEGGIYRITFETGEYFAKNNITGFYPSIPIIFEIKNTEQHYHVPLLLNPFGYSTYRGS